MYKMASVNYKNPTPKFSLENFSKYHIFSLNLLYSSVPQRILVVGFLKLYMITLSKIHTRILQVLAKKFYPKNFKKFLIK